MALAQQRSALHGINENATKRAAGIKPPPLETGTGGASLGHNRVTSRDATAMGGLAPLVKIGPQKDEIGSDGWDLQLVNQVDACGGRTALPDAVGPFH